MEESRTVSIISLLRSSGGHGEGIGLTLSKNERVFDLTEVASKLAMRARMTAVGFIVDLIVLMYIGGKWFSV